MNECQHIFLVHAYHDGELPEAQVPVLEAHLKECAHCAAELAALRQISARLKAARRPMAPPQLASLVRRRINQATDVAALRFTWRLTAAAAAILLACVLQLEQARNQPVKVSPLLASETTGAILDAEVSDSPALAEERKLTQLIQDDLAGRMAMGGQDNRLGE